MFVEEDWTPQAKNTLVVVLLVWFLGGLGLGFFCCFEFVWFFLKRGNITYVSDGLSAGCCGNHNFEFSG